MKKIENNQRLIKIIENNKKDHYIPKLLSYNIIKISLVKNWGSNNNNNNENDKDKDEEIENIIIINDDDEPL